MKSNQNHQHDAEQTSRTFQVLFVCGQLRSTSRASTGVERWQRRWRLCCDTKKLTTWWQVQRIMSAQARLVGVTKVLTLNSGSSLPTGHQKGTGSTGNGTKSFLQPHCLFRWGEAIGKAGRKPAMNYAYAIKIPGRWILNCETPAVVRFYSPRFDAKIDLGEAFVNFCLTAQSQ
jgi:hypothetical protein